MPTYTHKETGMEVEGKQYEPGMEEGWMDPITKNITLSKKSDNDVPIVYGAAVGDVVTTAVPVTSNHLIITHKDYTFVYEKDVFFTSSSAA